MSIVYILIVLIAAYVSIYVTYIVFLYLANFFIKDKKYVRGVQSTRFIVLIPAHNEKLLISNLLNSLKNQSYKNELYETIVIADNCTDETSQIAASLGANVLIRNDTQHIGKGYALSWGIEKINLDSFDAVFIIDADSVVGYDALSNLDILVSGGKTAIQCYNGVGNSGDSWLTRILDVSRTIGNEIIHSAKEKIGLSSYLMGNGMCLSTKLIKETGWDAFTIGEDWEYYAKLIKKGFFVTFAKNARVYHQESRSLKQATSQRLRWSKGRFSIAKEYGLDIFINGIIEINIKKVDAALPLLLPNPSLGMNLTFLGLLLSCLLYRFGEEYNYIVFFITLILLQIIMYIVGAMYTKNKLKNILAIFISPLFFIWKFIIDLLSVINFGSRRWVRTGRNIMP